MPDTIHTAGQVLSLAGLIYGAWLTFNYRDLMKEQERDQRLQARWRYELKEIRHVAAAVQGLGPAVLITVAVCVFWAPRLLS